jgi:hypothetical protein
LSNDDEWVALAEFLSNMIAKYSDTFDIDSMPDPDVYKENTEQNAAHNKNSNNNIAPNEVA